MNRCFGRSIRDFGRLSPGEIGLAHAARHGTRFRPADASENSVRAEFVRFLLLGGDDLTPVHERGVRLEQCDVRGELNLTGCRLDRRLIATACVFDNKVEAYGAQLRRFNLTGSTILGACTASGGREALVADDCTLLDGLCLERITADGEIRLINSDVLGDITLSGATINNPGHSDQHSVFKNKGIYGVHLDGTTVKGAVVFDGGFISKGEVRCLSSLIESDLYLDEGSFLNPGGDAISCDRLVLRGCLAIRKVREIQGNVRLNSARVGTLLDDLATWEMADKVTLKGFRFERLGGGAPIEWDLRAAWLKMQPVESHSPQPWEATIDYLNATGHQEDAKKLEIAKQRHLRSIGAVSHKRRTSHVSTAVRIYHGTLNRGSVVWHVLTDLVTGFGTRPWWTVGWMGVIGCAFGAVFYAGADHFGPSNPLIHDSATTIACGHVGQPNTVPWTQCGAVPPEYTTFQPFLYSLDLLLPLVELQQDQDWSPIVFDSAGNRLFGYWLRLLMWAEILLGWFLSLILAGFVAKAVWKR